MLNKCWNNILNTDPEPVSLIYRVCPSEHVTQASVVQNYGPASTTPGQHQNDTRSMTRARRGGVISGNLFNPSFIDTNFSHKSARS